MSDICVKQMKQMKELVNKWSNNSTGTNSFSGPDDLRQDLWEKVIKELPKYDHLNVDDLRAVFNTVFHNKISDISKYSQIRADASVFRPVVVDDVNRLSDAYGELNAVIGIDNKVCSQEDIASCNSLIDDIRIWASSQNLHVQELMQCIIECPPWLQQKWQELENLSTCYRAFDTIPTYTIGKILGMKSIKIKKALNSLYEYLVDRGYDMEAMCPRKSANVSDYVFCKKYDHRIHIKVCDNNKLKGVCKECPNELGDLQPLPKNGRAKLLRSLSYKILSKAGQELSIDDIVGIIKSEHKYNANASTVIGCIINDNNFVKNGNIISLAEWSLRSKEKSSKPKVKVSKVSSKVPVSKIGNKIDMIIQVIIDNGNTPMHLSVISERIKQQFNVDISTNSIIANIGINSNRFVKLGSGMFQVST